MKRTLLDTNAYRGLMRGDEVVFKSISQVDAMYASVIVIAELEAGFRRSSKYEANKKLLTQFLAKPTVYLLEVAAETAELLGELKAQLKRAGDMVPITHLWLAAHAVETGAQIITYDKHFAKLAGISIWHTE